MAKMKAAVSTRAKKLRKFFGLLRAGRIKGEKFDTRYSGVRKASKSKLPINSSRRKIAMQAKQTRGLVKRRENELNTPGRATYDYERNQFKSEKKFFKYQVKTYAKNLPRGNS